MSWNTTALSTHYNFYSQPPIAPIAPMPVLLPIIQQPSPKERIEEIKEREREKIFSQLGPSHSQRERRDSRKNYTRLEDTTEHLSILNLLGDNYDSNDDDCQLDYEMQQYTGTPDTQTPDDTYEEPESPRSESPSESIEQPPLAGPELIALKWTEDKPTISSEITPQTPNNEQQTPNAVVNCLSGKQDVTTIAGPSRNSTPTDSENTKSTSIGPKFPLILILGLTLSIMVLKMLLYFVKLLVNLLEVLVNDCWAVIPMKKFSRFLEQDLRWKKLRLFYRIPWRILSSHHDCFDSWIRLITLDIVNKWISSPNNGCNIFAKAEQDGREAEEIFMDELLLLITYGCNSDDNFRQSIVLSHETCLVLPSQWKVATAKAEWMRIELLKTDSYLLLEPPKTLIVYMEKDRKLAKNEADALTEMLQKLNLKPDAKSDLTGEEIVNEIDKLHGNSCRQAQIVFLMAHGKLGHIIDKDGNSLPIMELVGRMSHESTKGQPKLLILQCCQNKGEFGSNESVDDSDTSSDTRLPHDQNRLEAFVQLHQNDFFVMMSCAAGEVSKRNTFIQHLATCISDLQPDESLEEVIYPLRRLMRKNNQTPQLVHTLYRKLLLKNMYNQNQRVSMMETFNQCSIS